MELAPDVEVHPLARGHAHLATGAVGEAVEDFRRAVALAPDLAVAHASLGKALERQGDIRGAVLAYERAVALEPSSKTYVRRSLDVHKKLGDPVRLRAALDRAIAVDPSPGLFTYRASLREREGDRRGCIQDILSLLRMNDGPDGVEHERAEELFEQGDVAGAVEAQSRAVELSPGNAYHLWCRAGYFAALPGTEEAQLADLSRAVEIDPTYFEPAFDRARLLGRLERYDEALQDLERAGRVLPKDWRVKLRWAVLTVRFKIGALWGGR